MTDYVFTPPSLTVAGTGSRFPVRRGGNHQLPVAQVTLAAGDTIFTGPPEGGGPVVRGDRLRVEIEGLLPLDVTII